MTRYPKITCPTCGNPDIKKSGRNAQGVQRYRCWNPACATQTFMLNYRYKAYEPGVKTQAVEMALKGAGIRATARVLKINKGTVISALKKKRADAKR
ncbi:MAG: IS1-like element transposase [Gammaproteobacteria bacterium]